MTWHTRPNGFLESDAGRFDIFRSECGRGWVAIDNDHGKVTHHPDAATAKRWCEQQATAPKAREGVV